MGEYRRLEMEVQGPGADEWRHHDIISLSVPQALGTAGCGDGDERCRLVPASVLHGSLRELTPNSLSLNSKGVTVHVPALEGQGCMLLSVSLV